MSQIPLTRFLPSSTGGSKLQRCYAPEQVESIPTKTQSPRLPQGAGGIFSLSHIEISSKISLPAACFFPRRGLK